MKEKWNSNHKEWRGRKDNWNYEPDFPYALIVLLVFVVAAFVMVFLH